MRAGVFSLILWKEQRRVSILAIFHVIKCDNHDREKICGGLDKNGQCSNDRLASAFLGKKKEYKGVISKASLKL